MMNLRATLDARSVTRAFNKTKRRTPQIIAQELNRQRDRSRTLLVRELQAQTGVTPQKRIRNRIRLPRNGRATKEKLVAAGLALVHIWPARWFVTGGKRKGYALSLPGGARIIRGAPAVGRPFIARNTRGAYDQFRRGAEGPRQQRSGSFSKEWTHLPIKAQNVDMTPIGEAALDKVLNQLAIEWRPRIEARFQRELKRIYGA